MTPLKSIAVLLRTNSLARFALASGILLLTLGLFFSPALVPGYILSPADLTLTTPFFGSAASASYIPHNGLLFDQVYQFTPWRFFTVQSLQAAEIPLWNPYSQAGTPFVATMQSAVFYPLNLLVNLFLPFEWTFVASAVLRLWVAGVGMYLLAREFRQSFFASLIAATGFIFSGYLIVWLGHPHTNVAVWLPLLFLCGEKLLGAQNRKTSLIWMVLLALVVGIEITGGHIETIADTLFAFGLYLPVRAIQYWRRGRGTWLFALTRLAQAGIAIIFGAAIGAIQLFPFLEWLPLSAELQNRSADAFVWLDLTFWRQVLTLPLFLFPNLYNNPTWNSPYWSFLLNWSNYNEMIWYVGILPLLLAIVAIFQTKSVRHEIVLAFTILIVVCLGRALSFPVFDWMNQLPLLSLGSAGRLRLIVAFGLCVIAGFGTDMILYPVRTEAPGASKLLKRMLVAVVALGILLLLAGNLIVPQLRSYIVQYGKRQAELEYNKRDTHSNPLDVYYAQVEQMGDGFVAAFRAQNISMYASTVWALLGLGVVIWSLSKPNANPHWVGSLLYACVLGDLFLFGLNYNPVIPQSKFYPSVPQISQIRQDPDLFRATFLRQEMLPDSQMMFSLADLRGLDFPTKWYEEYLSLVADRIEWLPYGVLFGNVNSPLLRVLNLKYVLTSNSAVLEPQRSAFRAIDLMNGIAVARFEQVQPRAFMVYDALVGQDDSDAVQILRREPESVYTRVLLSEKNAPQLHASASAPKQSVQLLRYAPQAATWRVTTDAQGYLVVSDAYYPGWNAYVDGVTSPLYRANLAFRAVAMPPGAHTVEFRYEPQSFRSGLFITGGALTVVLLALCGAAIALLIPSWRGKNRAHV